ncbi:hypothetical protein F0562_015064 [Nyssa sinensis]|uniref:Uncharacterized protein n=1 Tax=Nyssa sinensis TaxID=561372 RepID=A0A5J4ZGC6_9ASTE|nr:hypothetical protein F0562_015064 [Nyssa sinensis]
MDSMKGSRLVFETMKWRKTFSGQRKIFKIWEVLLIVMLLLASRVIGRQLVGNSGGVDVELWLDEAMTSVVVTPLAMGVCDVAEMYRQ